MIRIATAVALLLSVQCSPAYPMCQRDLHCPGKQICADGRCGRCRSDADCPGGETCADRACVSKQGFCREDSDCPSGQRCSNEICLTPACEVIGDCPAGLVCEEFACVPDVDRTKRPEFPIDKGAKAGSSVALPPSPHG